ncbi:hypothetical protein QQ045_030360 [Rhodiola kirilowii]
MASSPIIFRTRFHARSVSLPSGPHPVVPECDVILSRLASSGAACSSSSSVADHLGGLQDLHDCLDSMLCLPETQQALAKERHGKWVDQVLDGSLRLLDICGTAKESLLMTKECAQELQSSLHRRGSDAKEASNYLACRKVVKKLIRKALRNLKGVQTTNKEQDSLYMVRMLREVEQVTLSVLESLLSFVSGPKDQTLVSKLMNTKCVNSETANEFEQVDVAVQSIVKHKDAGINNIRACLEDLQSSIEDLESGVESLNKHLIRTRVTLLNILSN